MGSLGKRISEILGIEHVVGMDFKFRCDQSPDPVVTVTFYPTRDQGDRIVEVVREYELVEKTREARERERGHEPPTPHNHGSSRHFLYYTKRGPRRIRPGRPLFSEVS